MSGTMAFSRRGNAVPLIGGVEWDGIAEESYGRVVGG